MKVVEFCSQEDGFTLLEVLVVISLLGIVSLAFILTFSSSMRLVGISGERTKAMGEAALLTEVVNHYGYSNLLKLVETPQDNYLLDGYLLGKSEEGNEMVCYQVIDYDGADSNNIYSICFENSNKFQVEGLKVLITVKGEEGNRLARLYSFIKKKL